MPGSIIRGAVYGCAAVEMWAIYFALSWSGVSNGLMPQDLIFLRYAVAGPVMGIWLFKHSPVTLADVGWRRGIVLAILAGPVFVSLAIGGFAFAPLSHGAVVQPSIVALASIFFASLILREAQPPSRLAGAAIIIVGLVAIASNKDGTAGAFFWIGDLMFAGAALFWVGFTIAIKKWAISGTAATAAVSVISAMCVVPVFMLFGSFERLLLLDPTTLAIQIVTHGVFSGILAIIAYGKAVENLGASGAALFPALVPASTLLVGALVLGEAPTWLEWFGALLSSVGLAIALGAFSRPAHQ